VEKKRKVVVAAVLIVCAAVLLLSRCGGGGRRTSAKEVYICEECGHQFTPDWAALRSKHPDLPPQVQIEEGNLAIPCPKCGKKAARAAIQCPKCDKWFLTLRDGKYCPHCGREP